MHVGEDVTLFSIFVDWSCANLIWTLSQGSPALNVLQQRQGVVSCHTAGRGSRHLAHSGQCHTSWLTDLVCCQYFETQSLSGERSSACLTITFSFPSGVTADVVGQLLNAFYINTYDAALKPHCY